MSDPDNPPYITVVRLFQVYHVNKMEYIRGDYQLVASRKLSPGVLGMEAAKEAEKWARSEGIEVR